MNDVVYDLQSLSYATPTGRPLQTGLTLTLRANQLLLIRGSNGCGKSTLLKILLGQFPVMKGSVRRYIPPERTEYMPQLENTEVHFPLTLRDVLDFSHGRRITWDDIAPFELLREDQLDTAWNTASGGERKRTLLTRALLKNPRLLVFDEPMNHLDGESRQAMIRFMARFLKPSESKGERAAVMVCHQGLPEDEERQFDMLCLDLDSMTSGRGTA